MPLSPIGSLNAVTATATAQETAASRTRALVAGARSFAAQLEQASAARARSGAHLASTDPVPTGSAPTPTPNTPAPTAPKPAAPAAPAAESLPPGAGNPVVIPMAPVPAPPPREGERYERVEGKPYLRIVGGERDGQYMNTSGNQRHGQAFTKVEENGRRYHDYGPSAPEPRRIPMGPVTSVPRP